MLDGTSLAALHATFPELSKEFEAAALVKMHTARSRKTRTIALHRAGYLGCYALGERAGEEVVLRLFPGRSPAEGAVGMAPMKVIEGTTFSPDLARWVAGRLATVATVKRPKELTGTQRKAVELAAHDFGDDSSARAVLACMARLSREGDMFKRAAALWKAAGQKVPLFAALSLVRSTLTVELERALESRYPKLLELPILPGVYVALSTLYKRRRDLGPAARTVIAGDAVFDFTYSGTATYQTSGKWTSSPWVHAARALKSSRLPLTHTESMALKAAAAFSRAPARYDGAAHLAAARALVDEDSVGAYVLARNAAAFHARIHRAPPRDEIRFLRALAEKAGWSDIGALLRWVD